MSSYEPEPENFRKIGDLSLPFVICEKGRGDDGLKIDLLSEIKVIARITKGKI